MKEKIILILCVLILMAFTHKPETYGCCHGTVIPNNKQCQNSAYIDCQSTNDTWQAGNVDGMSNGMKADCQHWSNCGILK